MSMSKISKGMCLLFALAAVSGCADQCQDENEYWDEARSDCVTCADDEEYNFDDGTCAGNPCAATGNGLKQATSLQEVYNICDNAPPACKSYKKKNGVKPWNNGCNANCVKFNGGTQCDTKYPPTVPKNDEPVVTVPSAAVPGSNAVSR